MFGLSALQLSYSGYPAALVAGATGHPRFLSVKVNVLSFIGFYQIFGKRAIAVLAVHFASGAGPLMRLVLTVLVQGES